MCIILFGLPLSGEATPIEWLSFVIVYGCVFFLMAEWFKEIDFGLSSMSRLLCRFSFQWTTGCGPIGS